MVEDTEVKEDVIETVKNGDAPVDTTNESNGSLNDESRDEKMEQDDLEEKAKKSEKSDDEKEEKDEKDEKEEKEKPEVVDLVDEPKIKLPEELHKTSSIFLRNLAPTITKVEVEAVNYFTLINIYL